VPGIAKLPFSEQVNGGVSVVAVVCGCVVV
jgi:hypothetical protein